MIAKEYYDFGHDTLFFFCEFGVALFSMVLALSRRSHTSEVAMNSCAPYLLTYGRLALLVLEIPLLTNQIIITITEFK